MGQGHISVKSVNLFKHTSSCSQHCNPAGHLRAEPGRLFVSAQSFLAARGAEQYIAHADRQTYMTLCIVLAHALNSLTDGQGFKIIVS